MTYTLLDEDEYEKHSQIMQYPPVIDTILKRNVAHLTQWIHQRKPICTRLRRYVV